MSVLKTQQMSEKDIRSFMLEDLKRSGIEKRNIINRFFKPVTTTEIQTIMEKTKPFPSPGYIINYPNNDLFRIRLCKQVRKAKYLQPRNTPPALFVPDKKVIQHSNKIVITEGEKKALCATINGIPTVALGGVWSFMSKKYGIDLLPELDELAKGKEVYIVFDNDIEEKVEVLQAMNALATQLRLRGCVPYKISLPPGEAKGLDDFIVKYGAAEFVNLEKAEIEEDPVLHFNCTACYLTTLNKVYDYDEKQVLTDTDAKFRWANRKHKVITGSGTDTRVTVRPLYESWKQSPLRAEKKGITYLPDGETHIDNFINIWQDDGVKAKQGTVKPFMDWLCNRIPDETARKGLLKLLAFKLQNRDTKIRQHMVFFSNNHQIGKSALAEQVIAPLFGPSNSTKAGQMQLESEFNSWAEGKEIIIFEEVSVSRWQKHVVANRLKDMQTSDTCIIRRMHIEPYSVPNYSTMIFCSNNWPPVFLEKNDTRHFCIQFNEERMDKEKQKQFFDWLNNKEGLSHIRYFLENYDYGNFDPKGGAIQTELKGDVIEQNMSETEHWLLYDSLRENLPSVVLTEREYYGDEGDIIQRVLYTGDQLHSTYSTQMEIQKHNPMSKHQFLMHVNKFCNFKLLRLNNRGKTARFYIVSDNPTIIQKWESAKIRQVKRHLELFGVSL